MKDRYLAIKDVTTAKIKGLYDAYFTERQEVFIRSREHVLHEKRKTFLGIFKYKVYGSNKEFLLLSPWSSRVIVEPVTDTEFHDVAKLVEYFDLVEKLYSDVTKVLEEFRVSVSENIGREASLYEAMSILEIEQPHEKRVIRGYKEYSDYNFKEYFKLFVDIS